MCGIVGAVSQNNVSPTLLEGLKRLEYRGYDSAGIAVLSEPGHALQRLRTEGKVHKLIEALNENPLTGNTGIAHTRWATHGSPSERNAHPHVSRHEIALVHNGIIENHDGLRERLIKQGYQFSSDTDTEVIVHLIHLHLTKTNDLLKAVQVTASEMEGAFALGIIYEKAPERIIGVRCGSPLVIGLGNQENFIASDPLALLPLTKCFIYLEEGDIADISCKKVTIYNQEGAKVTREQHIINNKQDAVTRGEYRHYMQKEIFEQPMAISETLEGRLGKTRVLEQTFGEKAEKIFSQTEHVQIVACGTSYHAGMVARYWLEGLVGIPCQVEVASEIRYRKITVQPNTLLVTISQSGETADTLAALRQAKKRGYLATLTICNVPESSLVRESDLVFMTRAGTEIGVASTKAFTTQLVALLLLTIVLGRRHQLDKQQEADLVRQLKHLPKLLEETLLLDGAIEALSQRFADKQNALFLGRGAHYPIALEGALKLKEISYIHAEGYPAGELKHGPLALVDKNMPVVAVAPNDELLEKLKSNLHEVKARGGELIVFADSLAGIKEEPGLFIFEMPKVDKAVAPIAYTVPLQLLAYHVAVLKGTDVDQPRNLAKSVTVE